MVMTESIAKINQFARSILWRKRLLALQDILAQGLLAGGFTSAALIFYIRWKAIQTPVWLVVLAVFSVIFGALLTRWSMARANQADAGFLIDEKLNLDDRFATSQAIIAKSETPNDVERALLEDASTRIDAIKPAAILPYRLKSFYALSGLALLAFGTAVMIPQKTLPGGEEIVQAQADIQAAGEQLEKTSTEIEKFVPPDTVTANLAKEQAELGRSLRRSTDTRAEALRKLSSLEERIKQRQDELKSTRADDIVTLAQRRMGTALAQIGKRNNQSTGNEKEQASTDESSSKPSMKEGKSVTDKTVGKQTSSDNEVNQTLEGKLAKSEGKNQRGEKGKGNPAAIAKANQDSIKKNTVEKNQAEGKSQPDVVAKQNPADRKSTGTDAQPDQSAGKLNPNTDKNSAAQKIQGNSPDDKRNANPQGVGKNSQADNSQVAADQKPESNKPADKGQPNTGKPEGQTETAQQNQADGKEQANQDGKEQPNQDASNPLTTVVAEQTAKALPQLSEQLLKKAQELRDGKISAEDIKKLAASAGQLAKDLAPLAQSKEFQKSLEEFAKQVNPKQLEEVARALMQDEKLQRELRAAAKLLWENRQVKDMVAGLTKTGAEIEADLRKRDGEDGLKPPQDLPQLNRQSEPLALNSKGKGNEKGQQQKGFSSQGTQTARAESERKLAGQGRAATISGQMQNKPGGDYVFSGVKPGAGSVKVPYSSAYPQYRRQAERTVERSQVPTQMRSMIRNYFDAINPNGKN
jgi:hypothetical protein